MVTSFDNPLEPTLDLVHRAGDVERQFFQYRDYLPLWNGRSLVEEYAHGNVAVLLDLVPRKHINVEGSIAANSESVKFVRPTTLVFHSSIGNAGVANHWRQQKVLVTDVQIVESPDGIISSTVRLYIRPHPIEQSRTGYIYLSPSQRSVEFLQTVPERELKMSDINGGIDMQHGRNPDVVKRCPEIMNGVSKDECYFLDDTASPRRIVLERDNSSFRILLNSGSVTVLQVLDRCADISNVFFGPVLL